uniref:hypothetical protein n=1 Tax=Yersinia pestis TaxID=632 RepID=UPI0039E158AB
MTTPFLQQAKYSDAEVAQTLDTAQKHTLTVSKGVLDTAKQYTNTVSSNTLTVPIPIPIIKQTNIEGC